MLALALTHLADRHLAVAWAMGSGPAKLLVGKGCTKRVVYDVLFMMCLSNNVIDAETKLCSNSFFAVHVW